ncbi:MAG: CHAT domain-containing protein [Cyclobacteriaceae bacterium]|nr:CHAT domain-containing protein [Cyclobacteriaceae bacterium]MDW8330468.1 CHAT domain-containing tetratricopeptide repeat protein [Cyclobacteriaceae bacterium]
MKKAVALLFVVCCSTALLYAQDPWGELGKSIVRSLGKQGAEKKQNMDSLDYQFAISVNENAGFFDIEQKGETGTRIMYALREEADKTLVEKMRDSLETGIGYYEMRMYRAAEDALVRTKNSLERKNLTDELIYLRTLTALGLVYLSQGKLADAAELINTALTTSANTLGIQSAPYVANLNNLAKLNQTLGKFNEAEKQFDEALALNEKVFGDGMQKAILLNNKAMLYQSMGRYEEAVNLMNQALKSAEIAPKKMFQGKKSFDNRKFQANLAFIYQVSGNYTDAENNFLAIKKVFENRGQTRSTEYAGLLNQLGILYIQMGKMDKVEELFKKSLDIYKRRFTENNIYFAKVTNDLGNFYRLSGRYADAEREINKALSIRENLLGTSHPDYINSKENLALVYWKTERLDKAYMAYRDVMDKTIDFINSYFPPMSEAEKTSYWDITAPRFQRFFSFAIEAYPQLPHVAQDFFDYQMATKALLLNSTSKVKEAILNSNDQQLIRDYTEWIGLKEELARMYSMTKEQLKEQKIDLAALERKANAMEKSLSERSTLFSSGYSTQKVSFTQIRDLLTDTEVVVDMVRVRGFNQDFTPDSRYVALILTKGMELPKLVVLENGNQLETRYLKYYNTVMQKMLPDEYTYDQFWARLDAEVAGKKVIYFSPDGVYNQINLNTLRKPGGDYLLNRYDIIIAGNTRDLIGWKQRKAGTASRRDAVLLGFPDYQTDEVPPLPGTKVELETVSKVLKPSGYQVTQYMAAEASEKNLKSVKGPFILHIATHGYFLKDVDESEGSVFGVNAENATHNPLLRSGLILAGAGKAISGAASADMSSNDNGILTAYEAMNMNLEGTALVVLSACETGLGDVKAGEGVYGLQRAFLVAGADALVMSLWKVDDAATQQLMSSFYTNLIKLGNRQRAFKQAQLQLMTKYKEPYYWGAFVMMGM